jgi:hypothetical protein
VLTFYDFFFLLLGLLRGGTFVVLCLPMAHFSFFECRKKMKKQKTQNENVKEHKVIKGLKAKNSQLFGFNAKFLL